jgi:hypothetical protein
VSPRVFGQLGAAGWPGFSDTVSPGGWSYLLRILPLREQGGDAPAGRLVHVLLWFLGRFQGLARRTRSRMRSRVRQDGASSRGASFDRDSGALAPVAMRLRMGGRMGRGVVVVHVARRIPGFLARFDRGSPDDGFATIRVDRGPVGMRGDHVVVGRRWSSVCARVMRVIVWIGLRRWLRGGIRRPGSRHRTREPAHVERRQLQ